MTPLEKAMQRQREKTCLTCNSRVEIGGVSYCKKDGKILHPMLLEYPGPCPIEQKNAKQRFEGRKMARKPIVLKIEDIKFKDRIYCEIRGYGPFAGLFIFDYINSDGDLILTNEFGCTGKLRRARYNIGWRAWDIMPTKEIMEATAWTQE